MSLNMIEVLKCHMSESSSGRGKELCHREKLFLLATANNVIKCVNICYILK